MERVSVRTCSKQDPFNVYAYRISGHILRREAVTIYTVSLPSCIYTERHITARVAGGLMEGGNGNNDGTVLCIFHGTDGNPHLLIT